MEPLCALVAAATFASVFVTRGNIPSFVGRCPRDLIKFKCTTCTFSTVYRANLSKHIREMHDVHTSAHLCRCGKPCTGYLDDGLAENAT
jgi:hypothetical protein